jgi:arylsulfatase A-like enzyme
MLTLSCSDPNPGSTPDPPLAEPMASSEPPVGSKPNLILISLESIRADHVGAYGYWRDTTPALDRLASEGILFEQAYAATSWTLPSHATLMTGLDPTAHGVTQPRHRLSGGHQTVAEVLAASGYQTAAIVSGPYLRRRAHLDQGFELYDETPVTPPEASAAADVTNPRMQAAIERFFAEQRDPERPFFLFLYFWDPHHQYLPPAPHDETFIPEDAVAPESVRFDPGFRLHRDISLPEVAHLMALYDGEIRATDDLLARLWRRLEELGLWNNTAIVVTADHGEEFFDHGLLSHKNHLFEEAVRVPLVVRPPGGVPALRDPRPVGHVDVFPTLLALADVPSEAQVSGISLLEAGERPPVFLDLESEWWFDEPGGERRHVSRHFRAVRRGRFKLMELDDGTRIHRVLVDLDADPAERSPRDATGDPEAAELLELLDARQQRSAARALPPDPEAGAAFSESEEEQLRALGYLP